MKRILGFIKRPFVVIGAGSLFVFLVVAGLQHSGNLEVLELAAYDFFIRMEPKLAREESRITIVEISEKDILALGRWPLTDETLARAIGILLKSKPRAIGVDIYRDIAVPPGTEALNRVFTDNPQVIGIMTVGDRGVPPPSVIKGTEQEGFGDILIDRGGVVRRALLFLDDGEKTFVSFALRLASRYLHPEGITLQPDPGNPQFIRLKDTTIRPLEESDGGYVKADSRGYQFLLDYKDAGVPFRTYSFSDLLSGSVPPDAVVDRIILVGVNAQSVNDSFFTPLSRGFDADQHISGVVLHGHIVNQLLRFSLDGASPVATFTGDQKTLWFLSWSLLGGVIGFRTRSARRFLMLTAGGMLILLIAAFAAFLSGWWIPFVPPALSFFISAVVVTAYLTGREKKDRAVLMQIFSRHVSKEIAEMIWQQRDQFLSNGRLRSRNLTATVLFSDLKGFTTMSERMDPQDLMDWLNSYMEAMAGLVMAHGGIVDNYVGDGIKADFGVPLPGKDDDEVRRHAMNAVSCALAMEKEMRRLNALWSSQGLPEMGIRVGIHTGPVVAGLLGSSERLKYTTLGDTVNIAARLESYDKAVCKDALCRILVGETTLRCLDERYTAEKIGDVSLKGKDDIITVHRVLSENSPCPQLNRGGYPMNDLKRMALIVLVAALPLHSAAASEPPGKSDNAATLSKGKPAYQPPLRGAPAGRIGGGTRGATERESFSLQVLAPDHAGYTTREQPCLYWYISKTTTYPIEVTVTERHAVKPLVEKLLKAPEQAGIQSVCLASQDARLRPNVPYKWFVTLVTDAEHRSKDILAGGIIEMVSAPETLSARLKSEESGRAPFIYAEEGFWYDALEGISRMIEASPKDADLRQQRASLLEQVGLAEAAESGSR